MTRRVRPHFPQAILFVRRTRRRGFFLFTVRKIDIHVNDKAADAEIPVQRNPNRSNPSKLDT